MSPLIGKDDRKSIQKLFSGRRFDRVRILLFTRGESGHSGETRQLLEELGSLAGIRVELVDIEAEPAMAKALDVELGPTTVLLAPDGAAMHYVGMPAGRQLGPLVEDLVDASRGRSDLEKGAAEAIAKIDKPTSIKVFVTPACLYSPLVVRSAHKFALANRLIRAFMIESLEFPEVAERYGVIGVPRTVVNETFAFDGAPGETAFAEKVLEISRRG